MRLAAWLVAQPFDFAVIIGLSGDWLYGHSRRKMWHPALENGRDSLRWNADLWRRRDECV